MLWVLIAIQTSFIILKNSTKIRKLESPDDIYSLAGDQYPWNEFNIHPQSGTDIFFGGVTNTKIAPEHIDDLRELETLLGERVYGFFDI